MAIIHSTTLSPEKLQLLASWLPDQPWYLQTGRVPELAEANEPSSTDLQIETANAKGMRNGHLIVRINRILQSDGVVPASASGQPCLSATWQLPDGTDVRGIIATAQYTQAPPARP
jgi:hypothetical protein